MKLSLIESRFFGRICYGFKRDKKGIVEIVPEEAEVVKAIFDLYKSGYSLEKIQTYLFNHNTPSPSGNKQWSRDVLNKLLNNSNYTLGIINSEDFRDVCFQKTENCRNPNQKESVEEICRKQQRKNWNGRMPLPEKNLLIE